MSEDTNETSSLIAELFLKREESLIKELESINVHLASVTADYSDFKQCFNNFKLDVTKEVAALELRMSKDIENLKVKVGNQTKIYGALGGALMLCTAILGWIVKSG